MDRKVFKELKSWKERSGRKPLLIQGARQVGKTWLMREFGRREYANTAYLSFADQPEAAAIFEAGYTVQGIVQGISLLTGQPVEAGRTLIILDEVQECERALNSLKFMRENAPEYHIMAAGSLLGVAVRARKMSFPVGQVDMLTLRPLGFEEFLMALGDGALAQVISSMNVGLMRALHEKLVRRLKEYLYVGGMPEAVAAYAESHDFSEVRRIQKQIIQGYERDFSKYTAVKDVPRIHAVWNAIPQQLAKDNRKFVYKYLGEGARAREYEMAVEWLIICGLLHRVRRVSKPGIPLAGYESQSAFKLYSLDCGLLGAMSRLDARSLVEGNDVFEEFKGALTEQYVLQELLCMQDIPVAYWEADGGTAEVDFVAQLGSLVVPIEVKAGVNLRARSLASYKQRYAPECGIRTSLASWERQDWLYNIPLYAIGSAETLVEKTESET